MKKIVCENAAEFSADCDLVGDRVFLFGMLSDRETIAGVECEYIDGSQLFEEPSIFVVGDVNKVLDHLNTTGDWEPGKRPKYKICD